jgi:hypothetical protein
MRRGIKRASATSLKPHILLYELSANIGHSLLRNVYLLWVQ